MESTTPLSDQPLAIPSNGDSDRGTSSNRVGTTAAALITGLSERNLREIAPSIQGAEKIINERNCPVWQFDEALLRGWVAGTVERNISDAARKALSGRFPCDNHMRNWDMRAWPGKPNRVYFVASASGHVKIGLAFNPYTRMKELQPACPFDLTLEAERAGSRQVEMYLHAFYAQERVRGEWFQRSERLDAYIARLKKESE